MSQPVSDLLRRGGAVVYIGPTATVAEAVRQMAHHNVGSILILEHSRKLLGIFTERDLLRRVVLEGRDPAQTPIRDVMTDQVIVVTSSTPRDDVRSLMDTRHIRHVPVADDHQILGVISLRDLLRFENEVKDFELSQLKDYFLRT